MKLLSELNLENQPIEEDPLKWLYKLREKTHEKYPTPEARRKLYESAAKEDLNEYIQKRIEEKLAKGYKATDLYIPEDDD